MVSRAGHSADLSGPVMTRALCHFDNAYWLPRRGHARLLGQDQHAEQHRLPRLRRAAGRDRHRDTSSTASRARWAATRWTCGAPTSTATTSEQRHALRADGRRQRHRTSWWPSSSASSDYARAPRGHRRLQRRAARCSSSGLALTPVKFGISFNVTHLNQAGALVHVYTDGSVLVNHGGTEMGQGLNTKVAQVVAHELGLPLRARARARATDTQQGRQHLGHRGLAPAAT